MNKIISHSKLYLGLLLLLILLLNFFGCEKKVVVHADAVKPVIVTEPVKTDSDDPAIWLNPEDLSKSIILGTDKAGILFAFDLSGKIIKKIQDENMSRLNNVDIEYGMMLNGKKTDIAVTTGRNSLKIHTFGLPGLERLDHGGFDVFAGQEERRVMGVAFYKRPVDSVLFVIVSRKGGPSGAYLWQYMLEDNGDGTVKYTKVREFGKFSGGESEIEAIAVDEELGYVYYSDELFGIRKYHADPDHPDANTELAVFGTDGFTDDREGISIYKTNELEGYILVSDQQANKFRVFTREGTPENPHQHKFIKAISVSTNESDGSEVTNVTLNENFPGGLFIAMSDNKTFQLYSWKDIAGKDLKIVK